MASVCTNISLPEETFRERSRDIGSRRRSRFISNSGTRGKQVWHLLL